MKLSNMLFATDFSATSEVALGMAVDVAQTSRARLHIVHVAPPPLRIQAMRRVDSSI